MGVDSEHPDYMRRRPDWEQMHHTYEGERTVKAQGVRYLSPTAGMVHDGMNPGQEGYQAYEAYRRRAVFPDLVREAVEALLGVMHRKEPTIELPESMEFLRECCTSRNETLPQLLRRINEEQLVTGRAGLLADVIDEGERTGQPYLAMYQGLAPINWDEGRNDVTEVEFLNLVVLDESEYERLPDFEWQWVRKYRVMTLGDPMAVDEDAEVARSSEPVESPAQGEGTYRVVVVREDGESLPDFDSSEMTEPNILGNTLDEIPFVFINTKDLVPETDRAPLLGLSDLALVIYRGEADYRQHLFQSGQDTLVIIGGDEDQPTRVGADATLHVTQGSDAKYIGISGIGLPEQREALTNDYHRADSKGGKLLDTQGGAKESGEALRVRVAAKTSTLASVAMTGAGGLQQILRIVAEWLGADPEQVTVTPNLDFTDDQMEGRTVVELMSAKAMGAPLSAQSVHAVMADRGLTSMGFEDEVAEIAKEREMEELGPLPGSTAEDGPEDDEDLNDEEQQDDEEQDDDEDTEE